MSDTSREPRSIATVDRPRRRRPSELRAEAWRQIKTGLSQLFAALAAERPDISGRISGRIAPMRAMLSPLRRMIVPLIKVVVVATAVTFMVLAGAMLWVLYDTPLIARAPVQSPPLLVEAANGEPLGRVGQLGDALTRKDFPDVLVNAVVSIEDRRFFSHSGVDLRGVARAVFANWVAGGVVEGGSTITQQLAKMQVVGSERSFSRKFREAFTAVWTELRLDKDEILTRYLNTVYLGAGMQGMSAAARMYFDKSVGEVTLPEAALLAGLIQAPSRYNPVRDLDAAHQRASTVIDAMLDAGAIDKAAADKAKAEPAVLKLSPRTARAGSWYADWIAKYEVPKTAGAVQRALRVRTTLQPEVQKLAEQAIEETLADPEAARGASQAALVAMRPDGAVVAMVGGRNYEESQFNRAVDAMRQPGSTFKLFVYYAALRAGYGLDDRIDASPVEVAGWQPENYEGHQYGRMTLARAFAQSVNSAAVRLGSTVGLDKVVDAARDLGLDAPLNKVPAMALGTNEVSLLDITGAFASVRAARAKLEPWGIAAFGPEGKGLRELGPPAAATQELPYHRELTRLLEQVVESGTGRAAALDEGKVAGKTGTSQDYRDAWFIGFNQALVVGVWVGNDDRKPMAGVTGGSLPAQIWKRFVSGATPLVARSPEPALSQTAPVAAELTTASTGEPAPAAAPQCDQRACASEYTSFRASDCTYQPVAGGPRRLCEKGNGTEVTQALERGGASTTSTRAACDRDRCARQYRSFDAATCTYQPYEGGPRRMCDRED